MLRREELLTAAIVGFEQRRREIDGVIAELRAEIDGAKAETPGPHIASGRKMSDAGRKRIAAASRKRWRLQRLAKAEAQLAQPEPMAKRRGRPVKAMAAGVAAEG